MSEWTPEKIPLAVPAQITRNGDLIDVRAIANETAALFDPNVSGDQTFPEPNAYDRVQPLPEGFNPETDIPPEIDTTPTHCLVRTQLVVDFVPMLSLPHRTADVWEPVLQQMAQERGKEMLTREEIELLCEVMLFGDECDNLIEITK